MTPPQGVTDGLHFTPERWDAVETNWDRFWAHDLDRPLLWIVRTEPASDELSKRRRGFFPQYPAEMSADEMIGIEHAFLTRQRFYADAFPKVMINFGAGSMASFLGAKLKSDERTVWFEPTARSLKEIPTRIDRNGHWYRRVRETFDAAARRWSDGLVQIAHTGINGNLDIFASLRGSQALLMDLIDCPEEVEGICRGITEEWKVVHGEEAATIRAVCRGTSHHSPVWAAGTTYLMQSDFAYMISPAMFERFVLPDLATLCDYLTHPVYHLDGVGQLPHVDMLLGLEKLRMIQWIPGAGQPPASQWLDLLARIRAAGKLVQVSDRPEGVLRIIHEIGGKGFSFGVHSGGMGESDIQAFCREAEGVTRHE